MVKAEVCPVNHKFVHGSQVATRKVTGVKQLVTEEQELWQKFQQELKLLPELDQSIRAIRSEIGNKATC